MLENIMKILKKPFRMSQGNFQGLYLVAIVRVLMGSSIFTAYATEGDDFEYRLNYLGFICFLFWYGLYYYCAFTSLIEEQSIIRILFDTKLKQYSDYVLSVMAMAYVIYNMWKLPFDLDKNSGKIIEIAHVDKILRNMCEPIDLSRIGYVAFAMSLIILSLSGLKVFGLWMVLRSYQLQLPWHKIFQVAYVEMLVVLFSSYYCGHLIVIRERYKCVNKILRAVRDKKSNEYYIFVQARRVSNDEKSLAIQEKYVCEKVKTCANVYSMLYTSTEIVNNKFGIAITLTMFSCLVTIIVHLFYLMEATASGLFHDVSHYCIILSYVFWHIIIGVGVIYAIVLLCEITRAEAKGTAFVIHQIINNNISTGLNKQAMQLSLQLLHQVPVFTARGLYKLDFLIILQGARTVVTVLVMLIQFVTDPPTSF